MLIISREEVFMKCLFRNQDSYKSRILLFCEFNFQLVYDFHYWLSSCLICSLVFLDALHYFSSNCSVCKCNRFADLIFHALVSVNVCNGTFLPMYFLSVRLIGQLWNWLSHKGLLLVVLVKARSGCLWTNA